jgi:molecular chaperone GrpE
MDRIAAPKSPLNVREAASHRSVRTGKTRMASQHDDPPTDQPTANGAEPSVASEPAEPTAEQKLGELEARHAEMADAYLRAKAEGENIRRRAEEEIAKARKYALESFAESLLPVTDSLEAAIALPDATQQQLLEGVQATLRQLMAALERNKVIEINPPAGAKFDPHQHQAITVVPLPPDSQQPPNTIVNVLQKGYLIADRVLRPALVTVAAQPS